jgi:uncharacterized protein (DUF58 family)
MKRLAGVVELFLMAGIAVLVALYVSAPVGWTFILLLGIGFLFSLLVTGAIALFSAAVVDCDTDATMLYKGETLSLNVTVRNSTLVPVPDVIIDTAETPVLKSDLSAVDENGEIAKNQIRFAVAARRTDTCTITYKAIHWGGGNVGIASVRLGDFTGLFSFPWHLGDKFNKVKSKTVPIRVFPNIPDIPSDNPLIKSATAALRYDSETEETKESSTPFIQSGFPGYTHRDYEPGDPLKRINWKLSAKRGSYLIRLDDETESFRQIIVLDSLGGGGLSAMERAVETVLAVAFAMVRQGLKAGVWYGTQSESGEVHYSCFECADPGDVKELQTIFAMYDFVNPLNVKFTGKRSSKSADKNGKKPPGKGLSGEITRFPEGDEIRTGGQVIYISSAEDIAVPVAEAREMGLHIEAVTTYPLPKTGDADTVWRVKPGFTFNKD